MSFENINYDEIYETADWTESRWYEIVTSRFMFITYRAVPCDDKDWMNEVRYVLDKIMFWTMPIADLARAEEFWLNIRSNVLADTLQDANNTFWKLADRRDFHVRPKARTSRNKYYSPISKAEVPKKAYWFNKDYVRIILRRAYGDEWNLLFGE